MDTELIKQLRAMTQAPMGACKSALEEAGGDLQKAVDIVKAKGLQQVAKAESRVATDGVISHISTSMAAVLVEVNSETDFVSKSPEFINFADRVASAFYTNIGLPLSLEEVLASEGLLEVQQELTATTKEKIVVRRWASIDVPSANARVRIYLHPNRKIGVIASFEAAEEVFRTKEAEEFMDNVVMQVAAMNPMVVSRECLSADDVNRQRAIFETQLTEAKKPQAAWSKIIDGKFNKWYSEVCLVDQESVMIPKITVGQQAQQLSITILDFVRFQVGEGLEKEAVDLAADVSALIGG